VGSSPSVFSTRTSLLTEYARTPNGIEAPVRFLLQSKVIEQSPPLAQQDNAGMSASLEAQKVDEEIVCDQRSKIGGKRAFLSSSTVKMKRKRRMMFVDEVEEAPERTEKNAKTAATVSPISGTLNVSSSSTTGPSINLYALDACDYLRRHCGGSKVVAKTKYFAYFQKRILSKYIFYVSRNHFVVDESITDSKNQDMALYDYLQAQKEEIITNVHQFKLAVKLALAVLQYHSTPWLGDEWRLSQLMLSTDPYRLPNDFKLFLNSNLMPAPPTPPTLPEEPMDNEVQMIETRKGQLSESQRRGINNTTLFCLGLAFLEIGHWKPLSSLVEKDYDTDEVDTARRLSFGNSKLGRRYDEIVRKCLQCNFGFGTDLKRTELQSAVYSDVVCPLEELIQKLDDLSR
jgi:hypothetical protein